MCIYNAAPARPTATALAILTDHRYAKWALRMLTALIAFNSRDGAPFDTVCLHEGPLAAADFAALQHLCTATVALDPIPGRSVRWQKPVIFYDPVFRKYDRVVYMDSDFVVSGPPRFEDLALPPGDTIAIKAGVCGGTPRGPGRYREFFPRFHAALAADFPRNAADRANVCMSTSLWVVDVHGLPAPAAMRRRVDRLWRRFPLAMYVTGGEQGFIQLLFWNETAPLHVEGPAFRHLYRFQCRLDAERQCAL